MGQQSAQGNVQMEGDASHAVNRELAENIDSIAEKSGDFRALSRCLNGLISSWS